MIGVRSSALALGATVCAGCGLEGFVVTAFGEENVPDIVTIEGIVQNTPPRIDYVLPNGELLEPPPEVEIGGGSYTMTLPGGTYTNGLLVAPQGEKVVKRIIPEAGRGDTISGADLNAESTLGWLLVEASMSAVSSDRQKVDPKVMARALDGIVVRSDGSTQTVRDMVNEIINQASTGGELDPLLAPVYRETASTSSLTVELSALNPDWWETNAPSMSFTQGAFDQSVGEAAYLVDTVGCLDPDNVRVVIEADFNVGRRDGGCTALGELSSWVTPTDGAFAHFVGGIHEDSPIQDPSIDEQMGNLSGSWTPNIIDMFDDGTNGDAVAGDNVWTITFVMPRGLRIGYKVTWGQTGDRWTGTEEWPGNQRIMEIEDINDDGFVYRKEAFGDEKSNKDKANLLCGELDWDTDCNGDGIPEARERPNDPDNTCEFTTWLRPEGIGPAIIDVPPEECPTN